MQKNKTQVARVALITGSARRIGAEITGRLHANGFNVAIHYNKSKIAATKLSQHLNTKRPGSAILIHGDLCKTTALKKLLTETIKNFGRLDALVNNASQFYRTLVPEVKEADWDKLFNVNLKAPYFLAQAAFPYLKKTRGSIINIADIHGIRPMRDYSAYCISKAGLIMLTQALAKEFGPEVRVNAVAPGGGIELPEGENVLSAKIKSKMRERTVLKRLGQAGEIAKAVLYLTKDAEFTTGQLLIVDGGRSLAM
jgi:pteridine reductase